MRFSRSKVLIVAAAMAAMINVSDAQALTGQLTYGAVTQYTDGTPVPAGTAITYNIYTKVGGVYTLAKTATALQATVVNVTVDTCFAVSAVIKNVEGPKTDDACFKVPGKPGTVIVVIQTS